MKRSLTFAVAGVWLLSSIAEYACALETVADWERYLSASPQSQVAPLFTPEILRPSVVRGQFDEPLVTDRPDFTESSTTVGLGVMQLEMGYTYTYNDDDVTGDKTHSHTAPEILFRYGFMEDVELRLTWTYGWGQEVVGLTRTDPDGGNDVGVGFKIDLFEQCCAWPEQAIILGVNIPTGANGFSSNKITAGATYCYSWELANEWSLSANSGYFTDRENGDDFVVWLQTLSLGIPLNDCWGVYVEYYGLFETEKVDAVNQNYIDGGVTWLWSNNLQFDFRVGFGLNAAAEDVFSGAGASIRF